MTCAAPWQDGHGARLRVVTSRQEGMAAGGWREGRKVFCGVAFCKLAKDASSELEILTQALSVGLLPCWGCRAGDAVPAGTRSWVRSEGMSATPHPTAGAQRPTHPPSSPKSRWDPVAAATALGPAE